MFRSLLTQNCDDALTALECVTRLSCVLPSPTPSFAGVHRLVSSQGPLVLKGRGRGPKACLCHRPPRLPLSGQRPVPGRTSDSGDNNALCWGHKRWQGGPTLTAALAPSLAAGFLRGLVRPPGLPFLRRLGQQFALGCQTDVGGEGLLEVPEREGLIHQAQGVSGGRLPGRKGLGALLQPGSLPCCGS